MRRHIFIIAGMLLFLALSSLLAGLAEQEKLPVTSLDRLAQPGIRIAVGLDTPAESALKRDYPQATQIPYSDIFLAYLDVVKGRVDACVNARREMQFAIDHGLSGVRLLDETYLSTKIAVGISPASAVPDLKERLNAFIAEKRADGTLDDMYDRWVIRDEEVMPDIPAAVNPSFTLRVGTTGSVMPYSYYIGTELAGYDIELARRFASWLGAGLEFKVYDFGGIIPAAEAGHIDCIMSNLFYTEEKEEAIPFSDVLFEVEITAMVRDDANLAGGETEDGENLVPAWKAYNGRRLGVLTGPLMEDTAREYFPDSEHLIFNSYPDCITALLTGKIDAYLGDEPELKIVHAEQPKIDYIHERITENNYSFAFRKNDPKSAALCAELNDFLARSWANGTMQELDDIWFGVDEDRKVLDMSDLTGENGTIRVVTTSTDAPFSYIKDGKNVGYDIDLVVRFCRESGYRLELGDVDFAGRIPAIQSGKYDFTTDMNVTPEREEEVLFSDPTSKGGIVLAVLASDLKTSGPKSKGVYGHLRELDGKRIGVQTGTTFDEIVLTALPDAQISYFNSYPDMAAALEANKIDGFPGDEPVLRLMAAEDDRLTVLEETLDSFEYGFVLPKTEEGEALLKEINDWLADLMASGELDAVFSKWTEGAEADKLLPDYSSSGPNGTLTLATEGAYAPMDYFRGDDVVGIEIDLAARFCEAYGYGLKVEAMNFDGLLSAVQAGKADFAAAGIAITEERAESINFSEPYYVGGTVMAVLKAQESADGTSTSQPEYTGFSDLSGKTVSMLTGAPFEELVSSKVPDVGAFSSYTSTPDVLLALKSGKTDAFLINNAIATLAVNRDPELALFPQSLQDGTFGLAFEKGDPRRDAWQAAFDAIPQEAIEAAWNKWTGAEENVKVLPEQDWPGSNGTVRVAACDTLEPMNYMGGDGELRGFDLEVILMIARELDVHVEFTGMEFAAILSSVQSGKADIGAGSIIITAERAEAVDFVEYYPAAFVLIVRAQKAAPAQREGTSFLDGLRSSFNKTFIREERWRLFVDGILTTLLITLLTILFGTLLGFGVFMLCRNGNPVANLVTRFCLWLVQGMPMVVLLMILYYVIFGSVAISGIAVAVIGFTLTFGASVFGLLKMGVGAVDNGQYEAAYALGYSNRRTFFRIILPQALPHVLPAYKGEIVGLIKATAIVGYIAVQDLTKMGDIVRSRTYEAFFPLIAVTVIYFVLEGLIGFLVSRISVSLNPRHRKPADILKGVKTDD